MIEIVYTFLVMNNSTNYIVKIADVVAYKMSNEADNKLPVFSKEFKVESEHINTCFLASDIDEICDKLADMFNVDNQRVEIEKVKNSLNVFSFSMLTDNQFEAISDEAEYEYFENDKDIELYYTEIRFELYSAQAITDIESVN